jgi:hypothetical protein
MGALAPARASTRITRRLRARGRVGSRRADRLTTGLAVLAVATAGSVLAVEYARRLHRRITGARSQKAGADGATETALLAGRATQDTVRVAIAGYESASRRETALFNLLSGFASSFAIARISTSGIRAGWWPFDNVKVGGRHIHHFVPGILLAFASGAAAILAEDPDRRPVLAIPFGVGAGLTFDEAALLLDLRDVYWTREGLLSVQMSAGITCVLAGTIIALRMLRRGEQRVARRGLIPDEEGEILPVVIPV